ncbi:shikimate dehydrogenase [Candidatus Peregrinibacteria bacterium]|nr:shikimate dehydrogenase [Candidatus Peregrinibacteria bacterium]
MNSRLYCVIGYPVKHSLSPKLHNGRFKKLKIKARYFQEEVKPEKLGEFMRGFKEKYSGANVTIPHKEKVMKFLDEVAPEAKKIGAVNVIVNRDGKLVGHNTDVVGAIAALKSDVKIIKGQYAVILGAGGAARAVIYGLKNAGSHVLILNRTVENAEKLAAEFDCKFGALEDFDATNCDILINTTSVGMWPKIEETPLPNLKENLRAANKKPVVMDVIYRPKMTRMLKDAKACGCKVVIGEKMFLAQAAESFKLWVGKTPTSSGTPRR